MAKSGDVVLGGRHLVGIFVALVVLFAGVFTLGYLMGRNQGQQLSASAAAASPPLPKEVPEKPEPSSGPVAPAAKDKNAPQGSDYDFYHSSDPGQPAERLTPQPKPASARTPVVPPPSVVPEKTSARRPAGKTESAKTEVAKPGSPGNPPLIPRGTVVLQVAAVARQADALALAQALQQKKFPAFVLNATADHYYRVQVGPYRDGPAANAARQRLEEKGFKSIVKR